MASGVDAKLLKSTKFPPEYSKKVDIQKVNLEVMKQWIGQKVVEILATEDDVVIDFIFGMLEENRFPDPRKIQLNITGFLENETPGFSKQLWNLLLSAQANPQGVPTELLEKKKEELRLQKLELEKAAEEQRLRREKEEAKSREVDIIRQREREERAAATAAAAEAAAAAAGRGSGSRRNDGPPPRRRSKTPPRSSRSSRRADYSPPPRRGRGGGGGGGGVAGGDRYGTRGGRRDTDTYIPSSRRETYRRDFDDREGRSHRSYGQHHHPRSPPRRRIGRNFYARNDRRARYSRSPDRERRRNSRRELSRSRSRSRSRRRSSRDRADRSKRRSYTPSSYSEQSSASSRSGSRSSDESSRSRSRSPRKDGKDRNRSPTSDRGRRGGSARKRHERLPHRSHADTREKRDRSHLRDETRDRRRRSVDNNKKTVRSRSSSSSSCGSDTKRGRERETTPGTKRHRSISADESNKRPKDSSGVKKEEKETCPVKQEMLLRERLLRERLSRESEGVRGPSAGSEEQRVNLLRERLLREKIKLLRRMSAGKHDVYPSPDMSG